MIGRWVPPVHSPVSARSLATGAAAAAGLARVAHQELHARIATLFAARDVLLTDSGTSALVLALRAVAKPGSAVAFPAFACIDLTAADVARANLAGMPRVTVFARDLLGDLSDLGEFDLIYCQEVLHHTSDPQGAFRNLATDAQRRSGGGAGRVHHVNAGFALDDVKIVDEAALAIHRLRAHAATTPREILRSDRRHQLLQ